MKPARVTLTLALLCVAFREDSLAGATRTAPAKTKPNILLFISDDQSWEDVGCYGNRQVKTPNIDRLAKEGMRFTRCFTATAMCAPTRQQLYTGVFPVRNGAYPNHSRVKDGTRSIVHHLRALGYRVGLAGKTHFGPRESFPFENLSSKKFDFERIERFLRRGSGQPYCLVFASNEPHAPWDQGQRGSYDPEKLTLPPYFVDTPAARQGLADYYMEITFMDGQVGRCMDMVRESGQEESTLFIFTSEQGSPFPAGKWSCYDTGLRTALVMRWPRRIRSGAVAHAMVQYVDILPTLVEAAGGDPTQVDTGLPGAPHGGRGFDGRSFLNVLDGKTDQHCDEVYGVHTTRGIIAGSECYPIRSIRTERYHYIRNLKPDPPFQNIITERGFRGIWKSWLDAAKTDPDAARKVKRYQYRPAGELYDVLSDPYELNNLANDPAHRELMDSLGKKLRAWMEQQGDRGNETELQATSRQKRAKKADGAKGKRRKREKAKS